MADQTKYNVISPDGFPISCEPFASEQEAEAAIPGWCERFKRQGYYSTANRERIPLKYLRHELSIVPVDSEADIFSSIGFANCKPR